jgi:hypothetical protein
MTVATTRSHCLLPKSNKSRSLTVGYGTITDSHPRTAPGRVGPLADTNVLQWLATTPLQQDLIGSYRARELHGRGRQLTSSVPPARRVDTHRSEPLVSCLTFTMNSHPYIT